MCRPKEISLFPLGHVEATPQALAAFDKAGDSIVDLLVRHQTGDWGNLDPLSWEINEWAIFEEEPLTSIYKLTSGRILKVTTDAKRRRTLVRLLGQAPF
jgi:CRP-like cAMP-binding protein